MRIALIHSRIRVEERLLLDALEAAGVETLVFDVRELVLDPSSPGDWLGFDLVFDRTMSVTSSQAIGRVLEGFGLRVVNSPETVAICSDKLRTTIALEHAGVPTPRVRVAVGEESALAAIEVIGYPAVLKPTIGSWGRLVARVNDRDAAEAIVEHRATLGSASQGVFYVQEHVDKPGRDIRVFVVGGEPVAAITRTSAHWVTNTARGASAAGLAVSTPLADVCRRAARAVGGDILAIDVLECPRRGLLVNEINHSMEFRNSIATTGVDIPGLVVRHLLTMASTPRAAATTHGALV